MRKAILLLCMGSIFLFISCGEDEPNDPQNQPPGTFSVSVADITSESANLSWTASTDPDGDDVRYSVTLGTTTLVEDISTRSFTLENLTAETAYSGTVIANDGNGAQSESTFNFNTEQEVPQNQDPGNFTVTVSNIGHNSASLEWTTSVDPDGDAITYEVRINNEQNDVMDQTSYELEGLASGIEISGEVVANDGNGGSSSSTFSFTTYVIDISKYESMPGFVSAEIVDCQLAEGGSGTCYRIIFNSNPVDDDGPFCPETINDVGGFGNYNGDGTDNGSPTDGDPVGFSVMNAALFEAMENDGYDIIGNNGNIRISDFSGMDNPNFGYCLEPLPDDNLTLTFEIPVIPESLNAPDNIETVEYIGLALDGVPMNGTPPLVAGDEAQGEGKIPSLDRCGGHHDPSGYYHWHFIAAHMDATLEAQGLLDIANGIACTKKEQDATVLVGYARDGYPIYSGQDEEGVAITDLDDCNGHVGATIEYPEGIYHYHASTDITNVPPCIQGKQSVNAFDKPQ